MRQASKPSSSSSGQPGPAPRRTDPSAPSACWSPTSAAGAAGARKRGQVPSPAPHVPARLPSLWRQKHPAGQKNAGRGHRRPHLRTPRPSHTHPPAWQCTSPPCLQCSALACGAPSGPTASPAAAPARPLPAPLPAPPYSRSQDPPPAPHPWFSTLPPSLPTASGFRTCLSRTFFRGCWVDHTPSCQ